MASDQPAQCHPVEQFSNSLLIRATSLFRRDNSLFRRKNSLFDFVGNWLTNHWRKCPRRLVRSGLPPPPRTPSQFRFPGATGIVFDFPWLCRREREIARSLSPEIGRFRRKCRPGLWPHQTLSRRNSLSRTETGSNVSRDRFESGGQPTDFDLSH